MHQDKTIFSKTLMQACWLFTCSVAFALTLPTLIKRGMFMDAMLYSSVSHNLSKGIGSFWFPYFDEYNVAGLQSFHEQPPLVFGIQALFYRVFGDSMYVERGYVVLTLILSAWLIRLLWIEITSAQPEYKPYAWLAVLLWITIPVCFWSYSNNMHENTMGLFIMGSVLLSYKAMQLEKLSIGLFVCSALLIVLAVLSKGFPGFFPLGVPFFHWLIFRSISFKAMSIRTGIMLLIILICSLALYIYPPSKESLSIYLFERAFQRISYAPVAESRFDTFWRLLSELIPLFLYSLLIWWISKKSKSVHTHQVQFKQGLLFVLIGLSGSLPLMLTMVQKGFYFVPSLPYFGIAFAVMTVPTIHTMISGISTRYHVMIRNFMWVVLCTVFVVTWMQKDRYSRDRELLQDIEAISSVVPEGSRINCTHDAYQDWSLNCYLVRYHQISINNIGIDNTPRTYFLTRIQDPNPNPEKFIKIPLTTNQYVLYRQNN